MTDEFDPLRAALKAAPPIPDAARKAGDLAGAMAAFDREMSPARQEMPAAPRPSGSRGIWARLAKGGNSMIHALTTRAGLAATSALVTAGLAVVLVVPPEAWRPPRAPAPVPVSVAVAPERAEDEAVAAPPPPEPSPMAESAPPDETAPALRTAKTAAGGAPMAGAAAVVGVAPMSDFAATQAPEPPLPGIEPSRERFANADPNPVKLVAEAPVSTFSVDVDTASWAIVRSSLLAGHLPDPEAVRVEEMVNYFPYDYPAPEPGGAPFRATVSLSPTPWNAETRILQVGLQGALPPESERPPLNLVFLIDTSGSMQDADKLPLLKRSLGLMLDRLRAEDRVAIVTYAGSAGEVLAPTAASDRAAILAALDRLDAGGSTAGQAGLDQAYAVGEAMAREGDLTRVILATDGDFNVGPSDPEALKAYVARQREGGAFLSVLGFGRGNLNDALMQALAQNGNGQAAYIDSLAEARKVLVDQLAGTLQPIAQDVKVQVEFNPAAVAEYRLIGYETRALAREDFNNDRVDAGEIGAGHQVTALYEVTPVGSAATLNDPLRYGSGAAPETAAGPAEELAYLKLRYKLPGESESRLVEMPIPSDVAEPDTETRFATAIAGFGQVLRGTPYLGDWRIGDAIRLAEDARGADRFGYRAEAIRLMQLADDLSR